MKYELMFSSRSLFGFEFFDLLFVFSWWVVFGSQIIKVFRTVLDQKLDYFFWSVFLYSCTFAAVSFQCVWQNFCKFNQTRKYNYNTCTLLRKISLKTIINKHFNIGRKKLRINHTFYVSTLFLSKYYTR